MFYLFLRTGAGNIVNIINNFTMGFVIKPFPAINHKLTIHRSWMMQYIGIEYNDGNSPWLTWLRNDSNKYRWDYGTRSPTGDFLIDLSLLVWSQVLLLGT